MIPLVVQSAASSKAGPPADRGFVFTDTVGKPVDDRSLEIGRPRQYGRTIAIDLPYGTLSRCFTAAADVTRSLRYERVRMGWSTSLYEFSSMGTTSSGP